MEYRKVIIDQLYQALEETLTTDEIAGLLEIPKNSDHGDVAFPCFVLAKQFRQAPQKIAEDLVSKIKDPSIDAVTAIGPYVNFSLNRDIFAELVFSEMLEQGNAYGDWQIGDGRHVPIDMSSPNIAKPMSMGHLRSTVIGNAIANLMAKTGYAPVKINHLGDWGTQFGKLIVAYKKWGSEEAVKADPISELLRLYVKFHEEAETNEELDEEGRHWFKELEDGNQEAHDLWEWFKNESLKEFNRIYHLLGIEFDSYHGEAFYNDKMSEVVDLLEEKGLLTNNRGADIVDLEKYGLNPALIRKSDGATLYITRDLAAAIYRKRTYDFAQSLYVVGNEQANHFRQLKAVLKEMGYDWSDDMHHIPFGLITLNGKKLSTRKGKVVLLEKVLGEAVSLAKDQIEAKNPDLANKEEVASAVGIGAVVFHDLKNDRLNNFDFSLAEVVQFEGETGPYVQYTHARAKSILRKAEKLTVGRKDIVLDDDYSWAVVRLLEKYPETVKLASEKFEPSVIAKYTIALAQAFNKYYANSRILEEDDALYARLQLVQHTASVLKDGLKLLGVKAPNEM
ncbi:arginine--tRNA ligase [Bavariicoccus seileri]|uniref:arginine--tRNA ligase n=1 Tax=Bavariicoccus seileri TaxID=549685 RepID=UPI0003B739DD|nr:arginine--tRNA ligase [Bavariicoccus seileri]